MNTIDNDIKNILLNCYKKKYNIYDLDKTTFDLEIPNSARKHKVREFYILLYNNVRKLVLKLPTSKDDYKVINEYEILKKYNFYDNINMTKIIEDYQNGFIMEYVPSENLAITINTLKRTKSLEIILLNTSKSIALFHSYSTKYELMNKDIEKIITKVLPDTEINVTKYLNINKDDLIPLSNLHGDLGIWNIRYDKLRNIISFIDWEDFQEVNIGILDLLNFIFTIPLALFEDYREIGFYNLFELVFYKDKYFKELIRLIFDEYCKIIKIPPKKILSFFPLYCQSMIFRIHSEGRSTENMFYKPFHDRFINEQEECIKGILNEK
ncbi:MAG: hypothetical protein A2Y34_08835 [Spirochaetes bacterium GWC1_27_15]|nr:MAG: hypothetical protein A2Y34_08835 [Spirochaetes bacterium GWC1_27_15]